MTTLPSDALRAALDATLEGLAPRHTAQAVDRLMAHYRSAAPTAAPILRDRADVVAYAAYRMPATFEAVRAALAALAQALPAEWTPDSHLDLGGGTGAAAWAVSAVWGHPAGVPSHARRAVGEAAGEGSQGSSASGRPVTVLDWAEPALALGRELAAAHPVLRFAQWRSTRIGGAAPDPAGPDVGAACEGAGLVTLSYVLGELTERDRAAAVSAAARTRGAVVIVEPGTPDGYARIRTARAGLIAAGLRIAAPCPHSAGCPIAPGTDWCHFGVRVSRSSLHRQVKGGALPYEDEKFSYVAAVRPEALSGADPEPAVARVLRRPQLRKGQVLLDLCTAGGALDRTTVTKRHGTTYRAARDIGWGDSWPPEPAAPPPDTAA